MLFPASGRNFCTSFELLQKRKACSQELPPHGALLLQHWPGWKWHLGVLIQWLQVAAFSPAWTAGLGFMLFKREGKPQSLVTSCTRRGDRRRTTDNSVEQHVTLPTRILEAKSFRIAPPRVTPTNLASPEHTEPGTAHPQAALTVPAPITPLLCTGWLHWTCNGQCWNIRVKAALEIDPETLYLFQELGILHY